MTVPSINLNMQMAKTELPEMKKADSNTNNKTPVTDSAKTEKKTDTTVVARQADTITLNPELKQNNTEKKAAPTDNPTRDSKLETTDANINDSAKKETMKPSNLQQATTPQSTEKTPLPNTTKTKENPQDMPEDKGKNNEKTINTQQNTNRLFPELTQSKMDSVKRRGRGHDDDDDEDENGQRRRRRPANIAFPKKPLEILEGAKVSESQTQDMFISSSYSAANAGRNKTTVEQLKEYSLGNVGNSTYETVIANTDYKEKNGIGQNMQKNVFTQILKGMSNVEDVLTPDYKKLVRDVVQGTLRAAQENNVGLKDMVKMIVSGLMAMSPHDDDPRIMAETIKIIVSEIIYGKINIGYNMKSASYYLGAASYTLGLYYKNYQSEVEFSKDLEQKLNTAFSESIWKSTGEISNFSQVYAKTNIEQFMAGRMDEEKAYQKSVMKGMLLSPIKKVLNRE
jgi:hypothetical protein